MLSRELDRKEDYDKVRKVIQFIIVKKVDIKLNKEIVTKNLFSHNNIPLSDLQEINEFIKRFMKSKKAKANTMELPVSEIRVLLEK